jgi:hypothetical protein
VKTQAQPPGTLAAPITSRPEGRTAVQPHIYEITFTGQAGATLRAEFDDCQVSVGPGTTTLRADLPDQAALGGLLQRIIGLRLELVCVLLVEPPAGHDQPRADHHASPAG